MESLLWRDIVAASSAALLRHRWYRRERRRRLKRAGWTASLRGAERAAERCRRHAKRLPILLAGIRGHLKARMWRHRRRRLGSLSQPCRSIHRSEHGRRVPLLPRGLHGPARSAPEFVSRGGVGSGGQRERTRRLRAKSADAHVGSALFTRALQSDTPRVESVSISRVQAWAWRGVCLFD